MRKAWRRIQHRESPWWTIRMVISMGCQRSGGASVVWTLSPVPKFSAEGGTCVMAIELGAKRKRRYVPIVLRLRLGYMGKTSMG